MTTTTLTFISDPGHGWLEVPMQMVRDLGIAHKISGYSYVDKSKAMAYLEEDCDADVFMRAAAIAGIELTTKHSECRGDAFVRRLPRFEGA